MPDQKRTMLGWFEYLDDAKRELTLMEFMAQMLFHIRQHAGKMSTLAHDQRDGAEHIEAMIGSIDEFMADANPEYRAIADKRAGIALPAVQGNRHA